MRGGRILFLTYEDIERHMPVSWLRDQIAEPSTLDLSLFEDNTNNFSSEQGIDQGGFGMETSEGPAIRPMHMPFTSEESSIRSGEDSKASLTPSVTLGKDNLIHHQQVKKMEITIRIHMKSEKCHAKALEVAASISGVESVRLTGDDNNLLVVTGNSVDLKDLVKQLRNQVGLVSIVPSTARAAELPLLGSEIVMEMEDYPSKPRTIRWPMEKNPNSCAIV